MASPLRLMSEQFLYMPLLKESQPKILRVLSPLARRKALKSTLYLCVKKLLVLATNKTTLRA